MAAPATPLQLAQLRPRHILLPFDLRVPETVQENDSLAMIGSVFPNNLGLSSDGHFVCIVLRERLPKPWPKSVAGLPCIFAPEIAQGCIPLSQVRRVSGRNGLIAEEQNARDVKDWAPYFRIIKDHFQRLRISITEVMYRGNHFVIILEHRSTDHTKIPSGVANIACLYLFEDEMARPPVPQARCIIESTPGNPDNGEFTTLQPGLRITSAYLPSSSGTFLSTTTGVLVKDGAGNEYMTVASHGFPTECGAQVTHPLPTLGRNIGELIMKVPHTDISLVKLHNGETFSNIAFQNEITAEPVQLRRLAKSMDSRIGDWVFLGSPGGGCIGGSLKLTSYQRILDDGENESEESWIFTSWFYMGQESASSLPDGMCGSAIWREDGDVIGFFRYAPMGGAMKDWCCGTAADELIDRGFTMVDTTDRQAG